MFPSPQAARSGLRETLACAAADMRAVTTGLEPGCLTGTHALSLLKSVSELERLVVAARVVLAGRVAESNVAAQMGKRSDESLVASVTGSGVGEATRTLELGKALDKLTDTREAFLAGKLSPSAAQAVAGAASRDPAAEARLLQAAAEKDLKDLQDFCRSVRPPGETDEERHRRERKARFVRFINTDCGRRMVAQGPVVDMTRLEKLLEARADKFFRQAWAEGRREPARAYLADALLDLAEDGADARAKQPRADDRSPADIPGVGPVPVSAIREILPEAMIRTIVTDGVDIRTVVHHRRTINSHLRTALLWRDGGCVECGSTRVLQTDHHVEYADGGPTSLDNLRLLCKPDHKRKTSEEAKSRNRRRRGP